MIEQGPNLANWLQKEAAPVMTIVVPRPKD
jgi:hypothetical protein